ncbi:hypothetical protein GCM10027569_71550 [Flindersiella endophytica]
MLRRIERILRHEALYFDFGSTAGTVRDAADDVARAYALICDAPRVAGSRLEQGDSLHTVRRRIDIAQAEALDAELDAVRYDPGPKAVTWTIEYHESGRFVAEPSAPADEGPAKLSGFAPTSSITRFRSGLRRYGVPSTKCKQS